MTSLWCAPTFSDPAHPAGHALGDVVLEGAALPTHEASRGVKRGRKNKKNSMSKCDYYRKKGAPCGLACPRRLAPGGDEGAIADSSVRPAAAAANAAALMAGSTAVTVPPDREVWRLRDLNQRSRMP